MPAFLVAASQEAATRRIDGVDTMVVFAADASTAKKMAQARYTGDSDAVWNQATVTEIVAAANWIGWEFHVQLLNPMREVVADVTLVATGTGQDTMDEIGAALVTLLNATDDIANASYNSSTNVLTIAGAGDALGDHTAIVTIKPPAAQNRGDVNISDLVGAIVHQGSSSSAVTVGLPADAAVIPQVFSRGIRVV